MVNAAVPDLHGEIVASAGKGDLWIVGGGNVASQFADTGLLDEVAVTIVPVVLTRRANRCSTADCPAARCSSPGLSRANGMVELRCASKTTGRAMRALIIGCGIAGPVAAIARPG